MTRQVNGFLGNHATALDLVAKYTPSEYAGCSANVGTTAPFIKYWCDGSTWSAVPAAAMQAVAYGAPNTYTNNLTDGVSTIARQDSGSNTGSQLTMAAGRLWLTYFTAYKNVTVGNLKTVVATGSVGSSLSKMGVYLVNADESLTLVATTANSTSMFNSIGRVTQAVVTPYSVVAGQRYAFASLAVGTSTSPIFAGALIAGSNADVAAEAPRLAGSLASQTDLPASIDAVSVTNWGAMQYGSLVS